MRFDYGNSRLVILFGPYAIKFARFRPIHYILRLRERSGQGTRGQRLLAYHRNRYVAGLKYVFQGILANIIEYRMSKDCPDLMIAKTYFCFLGLFNIQSRGKPILDVYLKECPFQDLPQLIKERSDIGDMEMCKQFARFPDGIRLIDCGSDSIAKALRKRSVFLNISKDTVFAR